MRRIALGVLITFAVMIGTAFASNLPQQATVAVVNDLGTLVGTGSIHDGSMEIVLSNAASGFVTLQLTDVNGRTTTLQALVPTDGTMHIVLADGVVRAQDFAASNAMAFELHSLGVVEAQSTPAGTEGSSTVE